MNIFLTGNIQVGKSTAIRRFFEMEDIKPLGFTTHIDRQTGILTMKLIGNDISEEIELAEPGKEGRPVPDIDAFNKAGYMLKNMDLSGCNMLVMDELGFMEKDAAVFIATVEELLDKGIPALGVLRNKPEGPFWNMLHERADTVILTVDEKNRNMIPKMIAERFRCGSL